MLDFGTITFHLPYVKDEGDNPVELSQDYLNYYDSGLYNDLTDVGSEPEYGYTGHTTFNGLTYYNAIGLSKISELKKYGTNEYTGVTITDGISGYTINNIYYEDHPEGFTLLTGHTTNFTKEEVINYVLTRNEHFLQFLEEPRFYSDIFVERGKQSVMEVNLRLGEIDNMGELTHYGNGYYKIHKQ